MDFITIHNYSAAIADLNRAIDLAPDFTLAYLMRAYSRAQNTKVEQFSTDNESINSAAAAQLASQKAKMASSEILADLDKVIALSPRMAIAHYNKGCILAQMQDYTSALSAFSAAIEIKPDMGEAFYNRGYVYLKLGNKDAGINDLSKAGELGIIPSYNLLKRMTR
jgi:tetratricopeptide (TPR) repeat protein